ncbi:hypothetical protein ACNOYE_07945 [Nannocystaceae bacterium ST9]
MSGAPIKRKDLETMACLTRVESFNGEPSARKYHGRLAYAPQVGCALVFLRDDERRLITSTVVDLESTHDGLLVETMNSRYRVAFLTQCRPQS